MDEQALKSPLHDKHVALGASFGEVGGWHMPLAYSGPLAEAGIARKRAGATDLSHLSRIILRGPDAGELLERVCTSDVVHQEDDTAAVSCVCNAAGGLLDVVCCTRLSDRWLLIGDSGNRAKLLAHLDAAAGGLSVKIDDATAKTALLSITGPEAPRLLDSALPEPVSAMARGSVRSGTLLIAKYVALRFGSTGLWSLEVMLPKMLAGQAWRFITEKAGDDAVAPTGLAGADVLRLEAGIGRYGHEFNETIDPFTAGLGRTVHMGHDFIGREALAPLADKTPGRSLWSLTGPVQSTDIPAQGTPVHDLAGVEIGAVTSATYSPSYDSPIALAYISAGACEDADTVNLAMQAGQVAYTAANIPRIARPLG